MPALIGKLYDVERQAQENKLDALAIKELRQQHSKPVLEEIQARLNDWSIELLPKSPIGQAVSYALGQWEALNRYIGRKNRLFAGSDEGAKRAAVIYCLVATCKLRRIDPSVCLRDVLDCISTHPARRIAELTLSRWMS